MSRAAQRVGATPTKRLGEDGDICPVCKSSRYLNPNMRFLVNPECYHMMCESCVDRIFSHGPAPCPIAGCKRTLRKAKFRPQTFEDLRVEREVDIRRRVGRVLNKTQDDFETLKDYNDYLEIAEESIWNLINRVDVPATEARLRAFEAAQKEEDAQLTATTITAAARDSTATDSSTARVVLKKGFGQRKVADKSQGSTPDPSAENGTTEVPAFAFKGLKKKVAPEPEKPYDPFGGWSTTPAYFVLQDFYDVGDWLNKSREDPVHTVGGYDTTDFYKRALCNAFSGFGVFVEDEVRHRAGDNADAPIATANAARTATVGGDVNMDDVF